MKERNQPIKRRKQEKEVYKRVKLKNKTKKDDWDVE